MNLVRKYKISKAINEPLTGAEGKAIALIESWLSNLTIYIVENEYITSNYYMSVDGDYVISNNPLYGGTNIRNFGFWETLHEDYNIPDDDIRWILKYLISRKFPDMKINTINPSYVLQHQIIEEEYKNIKFVNSK